MLVVHSPDLGLGRVGFTLTGRERTQGHNLQPLARALSERSGDWQESGPGRTIPSFQDQPPSGIRLNAAEILVQFDYGDAERVTGRYLEYQSASNVLSYTVGSQTWTLELGAPALHRGGGSAGPPLGAGRRCPAPCGVSPAAPRGCPVVVPETTKRDDDGWGRDDEAGGQASRPPPGKPLSILPLPGAAL